MVKKIMKEALVITIWRAPDVIKKITETITRMTVVIAKGIFYALVVSGVVLVVAVTALVGFVDSYIISKPKTTVALLIGVGLVFFFWLGIERGMSILNKIVGFVDDNFLWVYFLGGGIIYFLLTITRSKEVPKHR